MEELLVRSCDALFYFACSAYWHAALSFCTRTTRMHVLGAIPSRTKVCRSRNATARPPFWHVRRSRRTACLWTASPSISTIANLATHRRSPPITRRSIRCRLKSLILPGSRTTVCTRCRRHSWTTASTRRTWIICARAAGNPTRSVCRRRRRAAGIPWDPAAAAVPFTYRWAIQGAATAPGPTAKSR